MSQSKIYSIEDLQTGEKFNHQSEEDILYFANDIFWNDPNIEFTDVGGAISAIENSDYSVEETPIKKKQNNCELER